MGKHDFLTPKAISNRIKAKGLQKLRWYCQMCQKQCRDANGFKCHCESESHQRQMAIFSENPEHHFDEFSKEFEEGFMDIVSRRFRYKRVHANLVYNEYIKDKNHIHMNSTKWVTLTGFVLYLGKSGQCKVENTEKGWYITYIERDPEVLAREERMRKKEQADLDDAERAAHDVELRARLGARLEAGASEPEEPVDHELHREEGEDAPKIGFAFNAPRIKQEPKKVAVQEKDIPLLEHSHDSLPISTSADVGVISSASSATSQAAATSTAESIGIKREAPSAGSHEPDSKKPRKYADSLKAIIAEEEAKKEKLNRKPYWVTEGIVVKIMNKALADGKYYKQKGAITKVIDKFIAVVKMFDSKDLIKIDQDQLETVLPNVGGRVRIVNGAHRGTEATLVSLKAEKFCAVVRVESGPHTGLQTDIEYEDLSKIHVG